MLYITNTLVAAILSSAENSLKLIFHSNDERIIIIMGHWDLAS